MKNKYLFLTIVALFSLASCGLLSKDDSAVCGDKQSGFYFRNSHGTGFFSDPPVAYVLDRSYFGGTTGGRSTLILEKWVQHICPDEHVKFKCEVSANIDADFIVSSKAYWSLVFEDQVQLTPTNDTYSRVWKGNTEIGLKQAYGDYGEGEVTVQATIDFPAQGSLEADSTYIFNKLQNVTLEVDYYNVK